MYNCKNEATINNNSNFCIIIYILYFYYAKTIQYTDCEHHRASINPDIFY